MLSQQFRNHLVPTLFSFCCLGWCINLLNVANSSSLIADTDFSMIAYGLCNALKLRESLDNSALTNEISYKEDLYCLFTRRLFYFRILNTSF